MIRAAILSFACLAAPALAQDYYRAELEARPAEARFVARENVWRCNGDVCLSARSQARPAIACATLVRQVGRLRSFAVEGRAFAAEQLEACNARAR